MAGFGFEASASASLSFGGGTSAGPADPLAPFPAFAFEVEARLAKVGDGSPVCRGAFSEVTGLEATMEPKVWKEGGRNYGAIQRAGPVSFTTVVLRRGLARVRDLWDWWALFAGADDAANGAWSYRNRIDVTIALLSGGEPVMKWTLARAMPIKFKAGDLSGRATEVAIEELHLAHEGLHMHRVAP